MGHRLDEELRAETVRGERQRQRGGGLALRRLVGGGERFELGDQFGPFLWILKLLGELGGHLAVDRRCGSGARGGRAASGRPGKRRHESEKEGEEGGEPYPRPGAMAGGDGGGEFGTPPSRWRGIRCYVEPMHTILSFIVIGLLAAVVVVLLAGVAGVIRGGDPRRSNQLMRWRVILQALALLFLVLLLKLGQS